MSARGITIDNVDETPQLIDSGRAGALQTITARNTNATGCYVKIYMSTAAPTASSIPVFSGWVPQGSPPPFPVFVEGANMWIAAATEFRAGLSAPAADIQVALTFERASV
jgi:hypothetical protein